jgi:hypothetical protein
MPFEIKNNTDRMVSVTLNSRSTVHIAPRQTSVEFPDSEVQNNRKVKKLLERQVISLMLVRAKTKKTKPAKPKRGSAKKEK